MADNVAEIDWEDDARPGSIAATIGDDGTNDVSTRLARIESQNEQILCYLRMICDHPLGRATPRRSHDAAIPR